MNGQRLIYAELEPGDIIRALDDKEDCWKKGHFYTVRKDNNGFYINCEIGKHYLDEEFDCSGIYLEGFE